MSLDMGKALVIKDYLEECHTYAEAVEKFGISQPMMCYHFMRLGIIVDQKMIFKKRTILSESDICLAQKMYKNGSTQVEVLKILGVNHGTLNRALKNRGLIREKRWVRLTDAQAKKAKMRIVNGVSMVTIGKEMGCGTPTIWIYFQKYGGGSPKIDFKPSKADYDIMIYYLANGMSLEDVAFELNTNKLFIKLMIVKLGLPLYFDSLNGRQTYHSLNKTEILDFISQKFKGKSSAPLVEKLGTSRVTMDKILNRAVAIYMENING